MTKKHISAFVLSLVVIAAAGFFGGMKYTQAKDAQQTAQNLSQRRNGQGGQSGNFAFRRGAGGQGFIGGQILSKDDKSITVKMPDDSTKIVFLSGSSQILKSMQGTTADLATGQNVIVNGSNNSDGSITAQTIQIRPDMQPGGSSATGTNATNAK